MKLKKSGFASVAALSLASVFTLSGMLSSEKEHGHAHADFGYISNNGWMFGEDTGGKCQAPIICETHGHEASQGVENKGEMTTVEVHFNHPIQPVVKNNGHTILFEDGAKQDNYIEFDGEKYKFTQGHFHTPSENVVDGMLYPIEGHMVCTADNGEVLVFAVMMKVREYGVNAVFGELYENMPQKTGDETYLETPIDLREIMQEAKIVSTHDASFTTPETEQEGIPVCEREDIHWVVTAPMELKDVPEKLRKDFSNAHDISIKELHKFQRIYPFNARPVQFSNGREIKPAKLIHDGPL